jgi:hypothetical protein
MTLTVQTMRYSVKARLLAAVVLATGLFTVSAYAGPNFVAKFTLPYEVHWNHAVLPPGEYLIRMRSTGPATVTSASGNRTVYTAVPIISDSEKGAACLIVTASGNERRVRSLNLPEFGQSLAFEPLTSTEREMFAKAGQIDAVPVITARK